MASNNSPSAMKAVRKWLYFGIPVMFILGGLTHFAFDLSGHNPAVAIFAPVNESVWEHLKMSFWAPLVWWIIGYFVLSEKYGIPACGWFAACAVSLYFNLIFITAFYYTYTGAFGFDSVVIDILSFLLSLILGQMLAVHFYRFAGARQKACTYPFIAIAILVAAFAVFTFYPPHIPLFFDRNTGTYGIN